MKWVDGVVCFAELELMVLVLVDSDGDGDDGKSQAQAGALRSIITCESLHLFTHFCLILAQQPSCSHHNHDFVSAVVASGSDLSLCLVHIRPSIFAAETIHQCSS